MNGVRPDDDVIGCNKPYAYAKHARVRYVIACEVANAFVMKFLKRKIWRRKFQRDFHLGKDATFNFGIKDSNEFGRWNKGIIFLDDWTYFDDKEKKLGWINLMGRFEKFKKTQWIVHYKLK